MGYTKIIESNPTLERMVEIIPDVEFARIDGVSLKMQIITPWWDRMSGEIKKYPLVVFVQGSAWTFPNVWYEVPQLCELSKKGYVVATVTHRNSTEGHPFPACLKDIKSAIAYLRKNAEVYGIDADRVGIWGTSSGANLALLTAMTIGDKRYSDEKLDKVDYCVACFPPANLVESMQDESFDKGIKDIFVALSDGKIDSDMKVLREMSPYHIAKSYADRNEKMCMPPVFLAHGDNDMLIPYKQSRDLYEVLNEVKVDVSFVTVADAPHEGSFWSEQMLGLIFDFIGENDKAK